jgi:hypothetical protein
VLAAAIAAALAEPGAAGGHGAALAAAGWQALWPEPLRRKHALYRFGLEKLMRFEEAQLRHFFASFFAMPEPLVDDAGAPNACAQGGGKAAPQRDRSKGLVQEHDRPTGGGFVQALHAHGSRTDVAREDRALLDQDATFELSG